MNIKTIRRIRKYLTYKTVKTLVQCTVIALLDYFSSLYCGLSLKTIKKLQLDQNAPARLISKILRRESISHILIDLHWLIPFTIQVSDANLQNVTWHYMVGHWCHKCLFYA